MTEDYNHASWFADDRGWPVMRVEFTFDNILDVTKYEFEDILKLYDKYGITYEDVDEETFEIWSKEVEQAGGTGGAQPWDIVYVDKFRDGMIRDGYDAILTIDEVQFDVYYQHVAFKPENVRILNDKVVERTLRALGKRENKW